MPKKQSSKPDVANPQIKFNYIKSSFFRVVHADGAWGGLTPQGKIHMAVYNERVPIPQQTVHSLTAEGQLDKEIRENRITKEGIVREIEVDLVMDLTVAKGLAQWLNDKIKETESIQEKRSKNTARVKK